MNQHKLGLALVPVALAAFAAGCHKDSFIKDGANTALLSHHQEEENPPAPGFNESGSDKKAIALADSTLQKMGGRQAWDRTRYLSWRFFGKRLHVWDKHTGDARVEYDKNGIHHIVLLNLHTKVGRAFRGEQEVVNEVERDALVKHASEAWINDSYWIFMPYKLKDSGVTLKYQGVAKMTDGREADVVSLTFSGVGVTPENKYDVFVSKESGLVEQWAFYSKASDEKPEFTTPWHKWQRYGEILLSSDRGDGKGHTGIYVMQTIPAQLFSDPKIVPAFVQGDR